MRLEGDNCVLADGRSNIKHFNTFVVAIIISKDLLAFLIFLKKTILVLVVWLRLALARLILTTAFCVPESIQVFKKLVGHNVYSLLTAYLSGVSVSASGLGFGCSAR